MGPAFESPRGHHFICFNVPFFTASVSAACGLFLPKGLLRDENLHHNSYSRWGDIIKPIKNKVRYLLPIWIFPAVVLLMQILPPTVAFIGCLAFLACAVLISALRTIFLVYGVVIAGHLFWVSASEYISNNAGLSSYLATTATRFGLAGYLILFAVWYFVQKPQNRFFRLGDPKAAIRFPLVWKGIKETEWRFTLIFSLLCLGCICFFAFSNTEMNGHILLYGMLFALVNAVLEEFLWRGFILTRLLDISGEKTALIVSALVFGLYHYSLQFPIWTCLVFAVGGFYMGGSAIKSKGLLSPIVMHVMVNMVFVFSGII